MTEYRLNDAELEEAFQQRVDEERKIELLARLPTD